MAEAIIHNMKQLVDLQIYFRRNTAAPSPEQQFGACKALHPYNTVISQRSLGNLVKVCMGLRKRRMAGYKAYNEQSGTYSKIFAGELKPLKLQL